MPSSSAVDPADYGEILRELREHGGNQHWRCARGLRQKRSPTRRAMTRWSLSYLQERHQLERTSFPETLS